MTVYYVDKGAGGANGTLPSLAAAARVVAPGDEVVVRAGVYREALVISTPGTVWLAEEGHEPVIDSGYSPSLFGAAGYTDATGKQIGPGTLPFPTPVNARRGGWVVAGAQAMVVRLLGAGVVMRGFTIRNVCGRAVHLGGKGALLEDCRIDFCYGGPILLDGEGAAMRRCVVTRGSVKFFDPTAEGAGPARVQTSVIAKGNGCRIENSTIAFCYGEGIAADKGSKGVIVRGCTIHTNMHWGLGNNGATGTVIENNVLYWCDNLMREMRVAEPKTQIMLGDENPEWRSRGGPTITGNLVVGGNTLLLVGNGRTAAQVGAGTWPRPFRLDGAQITGNTFVGGARTERLSHWGVDAGEPHRDSVVENNLFLTHPDSAAVVATGQNGNWDGVAFAHNVWSDPAPAPWAGSASPVAATVGILQNPFVELRGELDVQSEEMPNPLAINFDAANYAPTPSSIALTAGRDGGLAGAIAPPVPPTPEPPEEPLPPEAPPDWEALMERAAAVGTYLEALGAAGNAAREGVESLTEQLAAMALAHEDAVDVLATLLEELETYRAG